MILKRCAAITAEFVGGWILALAIRTAHQITSRAEIGI
jgi:hypothetical protein